ncbi:hypothetical protein T492DRAFT_900744 [Pavlovales sp. CCMP2436]|nr:hypothetical protein T492DRAFT_900744 [Pavlovales sp. CCMP2436]
MVGPEAEPVELRALSPVTGFAPVVTFGLSGGGGGSKRRAAPVSACAGISVIVVAFIVVAVCADEGFIKLGTESLALILGVVVLAISMLGIVVLMVAKCGDADRHLVELDEIDAGFSPVVGPFMPPSRDLEQSDAGKRRRLSVLASWSWKPKCLLVALLICALIGIIVVILSQNNPWEGAMFFNRSPNNTSSGGSSAGPTSAARLPARLLSIASFWLASF